jgi:hypothetical protein
VSASTIEGGANKCLAAAKVLEGERKKREMSFFVTHCFGKQNIMDQFEKMRKHRLEEVIKQQQQAQSEKKHVSEKTTEDTTEVQTHPAVKKEEKKSEVPTPLSSSSLAGAAVITSSSAKMVQGALTVAAVASHVQGRAVPELPATARDVRTRLAAASQGEREGENTVQRL